MSFLRTARRGLSDGGPGRVFQTDGWRARSSLVTAGAPNSGLSGWVISISRRPTRTPTLASLVIAAHRRSSSHPSDIHQRLGSSRPTWSSAQAGGRRCLPHSGDGAHHRRLESLHKNPLEACRLSLIHI